jgi:hypothetical protein
MRMLTKPFHLIGTTICNHILRLSNLAMQVKKRTDPEIDGSGYQCILAEIEQGLRLMPPGTLPESSNAGIAWLLCRFFFGDGNEGSLSMAIRWNSHYGRNTRGARKSFISLKPGGLLYHLKTISQVMTLLSVRTMRNLLFLHGNFFLFQC